MARSTPGRAMSRGSTRRWRQLRAAIINKSTHCALCHRSFTARDYMTRGANHVDHIWPVAGGGAMYDPRNLQATCRRCNLSKGSKTPPRVWAAWQ
jgi:5-methylcytosine-specific restriction endonuclease McrA